MICDVSIFLERLKNGERISVADEMTIERLIRSRCDHLKELEAAYNQYCIAQNQRRNDPTIQEGG